jgi:hypothetical protein
MRKFSVKRRVLLVCFILLVSMVFVNLIYVFYGLNAPSVLLSPGDSAGSEVAAKGTLIFFGFVMLGFLSLITAFVFAWFWISR